MMHLPKLSWSNSIHLRSLVVGAFISVVLGPTAVTSLQNPRSAAASADLPRFSAAFCCAVLQDFSSEDGSTPDAKPIQEDSSGADFEILGKAASVVPFQLLSNSIVIHVRLNGRGPFALMLDSGAVNFISPAVAGELSLPFQRKDLASGIGDRVISSDAVRIESLQIGKVILHRQRFHVVDLPYGFVHASSERLIGGMGYELFRRLAVRIDFDNGQLVFYDGRTFRYLGKGTAVPFSIARRQPVVEGAVDGVPGSFQIDTGAENVLSLNSPFVRQNNLVDKYAAHVQGFAGEGIGGRENAYFVRVTKFAIGKVEVDSVVTELSQDSGGVAAEPYISGIVGMGILKRFNITLDYLHSTIYLEKNKNYGRASVFNRAGFAPRITPQGLRVASVFADSPAAESGISPGDLILMINGRTGDDLNAPYLFEALRQAPGTLLRLRIRHGEQDREVNLKLRDLL